MMRVRALARLAASAPRRQARCFRTGAVARSDDASPVAEDTINFPGAKVSYTSTMSFAATAGPPMPCYRYMDAAGRSVDPSLDEQVDPDHARKMYEAMARLQVMDSLFYEAQRQGRFSFYMTSSGEEAAVVGSAAGISDSDMVRPTQIRLCFDCSLADWTESSRRQVLAQYREQGVLMWRGFTFQEFADQCYGNRGDRGKGRQMPVHYGSKTFNHQTISSPLATQLPQAVGMAYGYKLAKEDRCSVAYFGDGAASEGDASAALNFAATLKAPVLFICRNNGWAISTPVHEQYTGDGIAGRALSYHIPTLRVDGTDAVAVLLATRAAREMVMETQGPVLLEAMAYRSGHHSTSDDSARYRSDTEMKYWKLRDPVVRFRAWLEGRGLWDAGQEAELRGTAREEALAAMEKAERAPKHPLGELFTDVYDEIPRGLARQEEEVRKMVAAFPDRYPAKKEVPT